VRRFLNRVLIAFTNNCHHLAPGHLMLLSQRAKIYLTK